jgi:hypothetical protein
MRRFGTELALTLAGVAMLLAAPAYAQGPAPRYPTPALSPWFNLYNKQGGPVDNYNMYVRPEVQLRNTLQTQQTDIQRQAVGATNLGQQVSQLEENRRAVQPTGAPTGFMNYGRFFGVQATTGQGFAGSGSARPLPANAGRRNWSLPPANAHSGG